MKKMQELYYIIAIEHRICSLIKACHKVTRPEITKLAMKTNFLIVKKKSI